MAGETSFKSKNWANSKKRSSRQIRDKTVAKINTLQWSSRLRWSRSTKRFLSARFPSKGIGIFSLKNDHDQCSSHIWTATFLLIDFSFFFFYCQNSRLVDIQCSILPTGSGVSRVWPWEVSGVGSVLYKRKS